MKKKTGNIALLKNGLAQDTGGEWDLPSVSPSTLLYISTGHRDGGGGAPSNDDDKISKLANRDEISDDGPSEEEISSD